MPKKYDPSDPKQVQAALEIITNFSGSFDELKDWFLNHQHRGPSYDQSRPIAAGSTFGGLVTSGAAGTPFPEGWTVTSPIAGQYVITHNLNNPNTSVVCMVKAGTSVTILNIYAKDDNSFSVKALNQTGATAWTVTATDFYFILTAA